MAALVLGVSICGNNYKLPEINQTLLILAKTVVEFIRPLVAITYKHDSLYTSQRLQSICMNPLFFPSDRDSLKLNSYSLYRRYGKTPWVVN